MQNEGLAIGMSKIAVGCVPLCRAATFLARLHRVKSNDIAQ